MQSEETATVSETDLAEDSGEENSTESQ
jgi:hypothetical protein